MQDPKLDVLKHQPLPQVAGALRKRRDQIISVWRKKVLEVLPQADELTLKQLRNSLPGLLDQIADALEASDARPTHELINKSPEHGETRFDQCFSLNELLIEYHLLRGTIFEQLEPELGRPITTIEIIGVNSGIDVALRRAAVAFAEYQARELIAEAEATAKYLSFLSHDIRGNLNAVLLMADVLRRQLGKDARFATAIGDLESMRRSILETVSTMDRFLNAERLRRGKMPVTLAEVNLHAFLSDIVKSFSYDAREQGVTLEVHADRNLTTVSDHDLLHMIVQNLVANAIKYGGRGTVRLEANRLGDKGAARISVIDHGPGIDAEKLSLLFAAFARGPTQGKQGTGLGLAIARQAADLLNAKLHADSNPRKGTVFHVELPGS